MAKYQIKSEIEAVQWNKPGDHPAVSALICPLGTGDVECLGCGSTEAKHGWLGDYDQLGTRVCPGDYIIEYSDPRPFAMVAERDLFEALYKKVPDTCA